MKQPLRYGLLILLTATTLLSCKNNAPKEAKYIPKDVSLVMVLDPAQLQDKLQKGGISADTLIARIFKNDNNNEAKSIFTGLKDSSGIKWSEKIFFFMKQKLSTDSQSMTYNVMANLKDAAELETYLKKQQMLKGKEVKKEKDYSYIVPHEGAMISWNNDEVIASFYQRTTKPVYDTVTKRFQQPASGSSDADLKKQVDLYFTQKTNESLAEVSLFTDMFKEKADGYSFASTNSVISALNMMPFQLPKLEDLLKDNYMASTLSFEDGKIVAKSTTYTNELLSSVLKKYAGPTVNLSMIEHYPSQHINSIILAAFNPEIFGGILQQLEVEGLANNFMSKIGFSTQDLYKSLKGDIAVVISDVGIMPADPLTKTDERSMMTNKRFGKMIFAAPVGDKASFLKIMNKAVELGYLVKQNNVYKGGAMLSFPGIFIRADEKNLIVASDSLTYEQYMANTAKAVINPEALDHFKGKATVFYVDIATTIDGFLKDSSNSFDHSIRSARATFKDVIATTDNFDGKNIKTQFELRMQNEKQNSLVTLTTLMTDIAVDMRVQAKREREAEDKIFPGGVPAIIRTN